MGTLRILLLVFLGWRLLSSSNPKEQTKTETKPPAKLPGKERVDVSKLPEWVKNLLNRGFESDVVAISSDPDVLDAAARSGVPVGIIIDLTKTDQVTGPRVIKADLFSAAKKVLQFLIASGVPEDMSAETVAAYRSAAITAGKRNG